LSFYFIVEKGGSMVKAWRKGIGMFLVMAVLAAAGIGCGDIGDKTPPSTTLTVKVRDYSSAPLAGVTVVLGDSTGAMVSSTSYAVTGASGDVTFTNPPANATVTFARSMANVGQTLYELHSLYDVNVSSVAMDFDNNTSSSIGTANVTVSNALPDATSWEIMPNWAWGDPSNNPAAVTVMQQDVQSDGKVSFLVIGRAANWDAVGFGTALDQTFTDGMNLTVNLNQTAFTTVNHTISNVPSTAMYVYYDTEASRKGVDDIWLESYATTTIAATTTCTGKAIPDYGDQFGYYMGVYLDRNNNGIPKITRTESWTMKLNGGAFAPPFFFVA